MLQSSLVARSPPQPSANPYEDGPKKPTPAAMRAHREKGFQLGPPDVQEQRMEQMMAAIQEQAAGSARLHAYEQPSPPAARTTRTKRSPRSGKPKAEASPVMTTSGAKGDPETDGGRPPASLPARQFEVEAQRRRLMALHKQLQEARSREAQRSLAASRKENAEQVRVFRDFGRHRATDMRHFDGVVPATADELAQLAGLLRRQLPHHSHTSYYKLFRLMDCDDTGAITFDELLAMVRGELGLSAHRLPDARLEAVWLALDTNASGLIGVHEFGTFMRQGQESMATQRARAKAKREQKAARARAQVEAGLQQQARFKMRELQGLAREYEAEARRLELELSGRKGGESQGSPRLPAIDSPREGA